MGVCYNDKRHRNKFFLQVLPSARVEYATVMQCNVQCKVLNNRPNQNNNSHENFPQRHYKS